MRTGIHQLCTFQVAEHYFGIEVERVQEVLRYQDMTRVPLTSPVVRGLINLRGQIVTALDMRMYMGIEPLPDGRRPMNVVLHGEEETVSLLVDEIGDVLEMEEQLFEEPPETMSAMGRDLCRGVYKLKNRLLLILDVDRVVNQNV